jgi:CSLREA domain-containing protein
MKTANGRVLFIVVVAFFSMLSAQLHAATFTVTSTDDPVVVDINNCTSPNLACSLREALAAADADTSSDIVVFDVDDTIHLTRMLVVSQPVTIDGGGDTVVRVHQGYDVTRLPDRNSNPATPGLCGKMNCPDLRVLQPTYYSENGPNRPMIELYGSGSVVTGLVLDGSITPDTRERDVERIDFESDGFTDFYLFTIESDDDSGEGRRWLVAGGLRFVAPWGTASVIGNTLRNFSDRAVLIEGALPTEGPPPTPFIPVLDPVVTGNVISGGAAGQPFASADGISLLVVFGAEVSDNTVIGFRNGLDAEYVQRVNVNGNEFVKNGVGVQFRLAGSEDPYHANVIESNSINMNTTYGLLATGFFLSRITDNEVNMNGSHPQFDGGIRVVSSWGNTIDMNEVSQNSGFGIVIDGHFVSEDIPVEDAAYNTVAHNVVHRNGGVGIFIFNNAHDNQIVYNESYRNSVGVVAGFESPFPYSNLYQGNMFERNKEVDVLDQDPVCNDFWTGNTFGTVDSASEDCVE